MSNKKLTIVSCISLLFINLTLDCETVFSQIVPDTTLGSEGTSVVTPANINGLPSEQLDGGEIRGANLFQSFQQFNVGEGRGAYFNNPTGIENILSRVTGNFPSNILGTLGVLGDANLFLINPNGLIFGPNARLDIRGSFLASTANSINLSDGTQFSATNPQPVPLLTINVPMGLGFNTGNPGPIKVEGYGHSQLIITSVGSPVFGSGQSLTGLRTQPGNTIALIGGEVDFNGGILTAPSGRIEVGSVDFGTVGLNSTPNGLFLNYDNVQGFQNIQLGKKALLDASGFFNGDIFLQGRNIALTQFSLAVVSNFGDLPMGEIKISATENLEIKGIETISKLAGDEIGPARGIVSQNFSTGKGADIVVLANQLSVQDSGGIATQTLGSGTGGNINLTVKDSTRIFSSDLPTTALIVGSIGTYTSGGGRGGNLELSTNKLSIETGGIFASESFSSGDGGNVVINASDRIEILGGRQLSFDTNFVNNSFWPSFPGALTTSSGNAGNVYVNTNDLILENGGRLDSSTLASGSAGSLIINAANSINVSGRDPRLLNPTQVISSANVADPFFNLIFNIPNTLEGKSGYVTINTNRLTVGDGARISVRNDGNTAGGTLQINADSIDLDRVSITASAAFGEGGNIFLQTQNFQLLNNSAITATAGGSGNGGNITLSTGTLAALEDSDITANAVQGRGGNIQIDTQGLFLSPDSEITASSRRGPQYSGIVQINAQNVDLTRAGFQPVPGPESPEVSSVCQGQSSGEGELVNTGTGGVPASPSDPLSSSTGWNDNSLPPQVVESLQEPTKSDPEKPMQIVEAQGWKRNANGTVSMTADVLETVQYSSLATLLCFTN